MANTRVYVLDSNRQPVPVGVPGELYVGGHGVAAGYLNRPELTAERFLADPFSPEPGARMYRTGDRVRWRADGTLEYLGRADFQVKVRGHRVEPGEVEAALRRHPEVRDAVVTARTDGAGENRLVAYLVPANGTAPQATGLREFLAGLLPEPMIPGAFVPLDAFPLTPNGKIDRKALPSPGPNGTATGRHVEPRTPLERELARVWARALGGPRVGAEDNFFDLGGNSLSAVRIFFEVREQFAVALPLRTLFEAPTVARFARRLEEKLLDQCDPAELDRLLAEVERLSDQEVRALLNEAAGSDRSPLSPAESGVRG
jgi:acyl carrier protein